MIENDSLVAINVYDKITYMLYNKSCVPILFYWNGQGDLLESILKDEKFKETYLNTIIDYNVFKNLIISYFYFKFGEDGKEIYDDRVESIYKYVKLKDFNSEQIIYQLVIPHFYELYEKALKEKYEDTKVFNKEIITDIYTKIKNKYKEKIEKTTILNWIRSELINNDKIDNDNINYIIEKLTKILEHEN